MGVGSSDPPSRRGIAVFYLLEASVTVALFYFLYSLSGAVGGIKVRVEEGIVASFLSLGFLAYFLGLRHALDADHLAAIDNATRKLMQEGKSSHFTGLFFSLGHSTVVILLALALIAATREVASRIPSLESLGSLVGTMVSGGFLYLIGFLNFIVLLEIYRVFKEVRDRGADESQINEALLKRGFMNRYLGGLFRVVNTQYHMYPIGFLFGLGFDTASETALLAISAAASGVFLKVPLWTLVVFPLLFTAGMTLLDTTDGLFMSSAYRWAFLGDQMRKVWYNLTMTFISILVCYLVGTLEVLGLIQSELGLSGPIWDWVSLINGGVWWGNIGLIIIFTFALTWGMSVLLFKVVIERENQRRVD